MTSQVPLIALPDTKVEQSGKAVPQHAADADTSSYLKWPLRGEDDQAQP